MAAGDSLETFRSAVGPSLAQICASDACLSVHHSVSARRGPRTDSAGPPRHASELSPRGAELITHGESGRSGVGRTRNVVAPTSLAGQFEQPYGPRGPPTLFTIPVLRYMKTYGLAHEQLGWSRSCSANGR